MELVHLGRYLDVKDPSLHSFKELRKMPPVWFTHDMRLCDDPENLAYAKQLAGQGYAVVCIRRRPPVVNFVDRTKFPRRILFEMTSKCNFLCRMCPQQSLVRPRMDMAPELYCKVIDEIDRYGIEGLWLYHLGESLLHPAFRQIVDYVGRKKNLGVIWMSTNGQYFTEENIRCVLRSNIDYVNFSAHAVTEEAYKKVAPQGDFNIVQGNLEKFYELKGDISSGPRKPFLHCQMIEQEPTKHEVDAFIERHYKRAEIVSINMLEYVHFSNNSFGMKQRERKPLRHCTRVGRGDCFIFSNGHVTLCDFSYNGEIFLGDVNEQSLFDIWNGEKRRHILELNEEGKMADMEFCRGCTDYDI